MKKFTAFLLTLILIFSALGFTQAFQVSAEGTTFNGKAVSLGDTVVYSYYLKTPMKVVTTDFVINYTGATLRLVSETKAERFPVVNPGGMFNDALENQIRATCSNIGAMYDFTNGGYLFKISFVVVGEGESCASVTLPFLKGVNPQGISQPEIMLIQNNEVVYDGVTFTEDVTVKGSCNHSFTQTVTPASCTQDGAVVNICSLCNAVKTNVIPATGHSFGQWTLTRYSTEVLEGEETRACSVCGFEEYRSIPLLGTVLGDLDGDGKLTGSDSMIIQKYVVKIITKSAFIYSNADLNLDGTVNIKDATVIQKSAVGLL